MTKVQGISEVKAMRRSFNPLLAVTAGFSLLLAACSGESPTSPKPPTTDPGTGGTCTVTVALDATSVTPMAGTAVIVRATVRKGGATVPDGTSITFTTDFGYFLETGLPNVSKVTQNGFADVTLGATSSGTSKVKAAFECGSAEKSIEYQPVPQSGPFVSSITPTSGSCAGGDVVTIHGGRFGTEASETRVSFGGRPATIRFVTDARIEVLTPTRTLANPLVPETVDILLQFFSGDIPLGSLTVRNAFTYYCVDPTKRMTVTSLSPVNGSPEGGDQVVINGTNFLPEPASSPATTRVTFGGAAASISSVNGTQITVRTPRRILANPAVPETVDVTVTVDLGLVSQQSAGLSQAFTYRGTGGSTACNGTPGLFISTVKPADPTNAGSPDGGDIVEISGGGFLAGATPSVALSRTQVFFGGVQGVVLDPMSDSTLRVSTPRRVLTSPDRPETVDVKVIVDAGGPKEGCALAPAAYSYYPGGFLEPVITSISPVTGPNDASTRVTIFGRNFKLPQQVFVRGGGVTVEAAVVEIRTNEIIFLTPVATGPNSALAGQTVDVVVRDPYAGKEFTSPVKFRYYSCPSVNTVIPAIAPWNQSTTVTIAGQNFEEPVEVTYTFDTRVIRPTVTSVSSSLITIVMPPIDPSLGGTTAACSNVAGALSLSFPTLATCSSPTAAFTYAISPMTAVSATPTQLNQAGGPFGSPIGGSAATITVVGSNFVDPMTVTLVKDGQVVANTPVNNAIVANATQLSFTAPAVRDADLNTQVCVPGGGTTTSGTRRVPTSFGIRLTNTRTRCTVELPNVLVYNPADGSCGSPIVVSGSASPTATLCTPYPNATYTAVGGAAPLTFTVDGLPPGLVATASANTVTISGTPILPAAGPGVASTSYDATLTVTDASTETADVTVRIPIKVTDPVAPFSITVPASATIPATGGSTPLFSVTPNPIPVSFAPVTWTIADVFPAPVTGTVTFVSADSGQIGNLVVSAAVPQGQYTVTLRATDTTCAGGPRHTAQASYVFTKLATGGGTTLALNGTAPPTATICTPYPSSTFTAAGGTPPYSFTVTNLPPGLTATPGATSVTLSGTPVLPASGPGQASAAYTVTIGLSDASASTPDVSLAVPITVTDPVASDPGFGFAMPTNTIVGPAGGVLQPFEASPSPLPPGFEPYQWTIVEIVPNPQSAAVRLDPVPGGPLAYLTVPPGVAAGEYTVTIRLTDTPSCGGAPHLVQQNFKFTKE